MEHGLEGNRSGGFLKNEGYDGVIKQLKLINKVVSLLQVRNKWDHLISVWKVWKQLFETGSVYDLDFGKIDASDEWWERKLKECPKAKMFCTKGLSNARAMEIMFEGIVATGKHA
nr:l10-interacting myb domain-containing protein [Quercus suber]